MLFDHRALKIYVDGSALKNPGGPGGCAAVAEFPEDWNRPNELIFQAGYKATTNNRMELIACIRAFDYVRDHRHDLRLQRVLIVTDALYVHSYYRHAPNWRGNGWRTSDGRPVENADLWKGFLSAQSKVGVRTEIHWSKGKTTPVLNEVDRAAKYAARHPSETDWGFRPGKVARSKITVKGASAPFPASGQEAVICIYRKSSVGKTDHKIFFHIYSEEKRELTGKFRAYAKAAEDGELHRSHFYRVRFNSNPRYPIIESVVEEFFPEDRASN
jgi:ribonuclease HI